MNACMHRQVNTSDLKEVASAIGPLTKLVWVENPTNPQIQIPDIRVSCFLLLVGIVLFMFLLLFFPFVTLICYMSQAT